MCHSSRSASNKKTLSESAASEIWGSDWLLQSDATAIKQYMSICWRNNDMQKTFREIKCIAAKPSTTRETVKTLLLTNEGKKVINGEKDLLVDSFVYI